MTRGHANTGVIVFCIDDERGRLQHQLKVRREVIADHDAEELEKILDAQRRCSDVAPFKLYLKDHLSTGIVVATDDGSGRACSGGRRAEA